MLGPLKLAGDPVNPLDAATKQYIDSTYTVNINASYLLLTGGNMQGNLSLATNPTAPLHAATKQYVDALIASIGSGGGGGPGGDVAVTSFNARIGDVILLSLDVTSALSYVPYNGTTNPNNYQTGAQVTTALASYAPLASPIFTGVVSLPANSVGVTPLTADNSTKLATTAYVKANVPAGTVAEITLGPTFPVSPTAGNLHWSTLDGDLYIYTGTAWTEATPDTGTGAEGTAGVTTFNGRPGDVVLVNTDVTAALGFTPYSTTNPNGYQTASQVSTAVAVETTRATTAENLLAPKASPVLTGTPTAPTATVGTNTTQLATTAFVLANAAGGVTARDTARMQAQWVMGAIVENDTFWFAYNAPYGGTINSLEHFSLTGTFTVAVQINGTNVTGLSAVAVDASSTVTNATAARTFTAGQRITCIVSAATGSPTDALLSLNVTWS
jgi:hypothetical protein